MNKIAPAALLLVSLLLPAGTPFAQSAPAATTPPNAPTPGKGEAQALKLFHLLDTDGDGRISRAEAAVAIRLKPSIAELFRTADTNGDGYLTQTEIRAAAERRRAERMARQQASQSAGNVSGR